MPAAAPEKPFRLNIVGDLWVQIGKMRKDRALFLAVLGNTYFWFLGSLLFSTIVVYGPDVLHVGQTKTGYLNAMLAVGIGIGSMAAGWISDNKIEYGLIPLGSIGMTCTGLALGITPHGMAGSAVLLGVLGFWAGFFAVPVNALIQHKPADEDKGGIIAAANLLSFVGIAISSGVYFVFTDYIHLDPRGVIVAASCITAFGTAYVLYLLPEWFGRLILFFVTRTVYRVRVIGRDNFPEKTGALLVCNHMSFVDVALLVAATDRPIRFLMYQGHLRPSGGQAVRQNGEGDSDFQRAASARDAALAEGSERRAARRRDRVHLRRRADHAHRPTASLPPRTGTHHEGRRCPHHSREPGRRVGQHLQLRARALSVEDAAAHSVSRHGELRQADAVDVDRSRSARRGAGVASRRRSRRASRT